MHLALLLLRLMLLGLVLLQKQLLPLLLLSGLLLVLPSWNPASRWCTAGSDWL